MLIGCYQVGFSFLRSIFLLICHSAFMYIVLLGKYIHGSQSRLAGS